MLQRSQWVLQQMRRPHSLPEEPEEPEGPEGPEEVVHHIHQVPHFGTAVQGEHQAGTGSGEGIVPVLAGRPTSNKISELLWVTLCVLHVNEHIRLAATAGNPCCCEGKAP